MDRTGNERTGNRMLNIPVKGGAELTEATMAAINGDDMQPRQPLLPGLKLPGVYRGIATTETGRTVSRRSA